MLIGCWAAQSPNPPRPPTAGCRPCSKHWRQTPQQGPAAQKPCRETEKQRTSFCFLWQTVCFDSLPACPSPQQATAKEETATATGASSRQFSFLVPSRHTTAMGKHNGKSRSAGGTKVGAALTRRHKVRVGGRAQWVVGHVSICRAASPRAPAQQQPGKSSRLTICC